MGDATKNIASTYKCDIKVAVGFHCADCMEINSLMRVSTFVFTAIRRIPTNRGMANSHMGTCDHGKYM